MRIRDSLSTLAGALALCAAAVLLAATLAACSLGGGGGMFQPENPAVAPQASAAKIKVGLLLPLGASGNTAAIAKSLKQAGELALFDFDNPNILLVSKDTRGTGEGARAAAQAAIDEGAELIIGPVFAQEVSAAAPVARDANVPMLAFSSDEKVAGDGVYLLSFLAGRDVARIVSYAAAHGKRNFVALIPQSPYGRIVDGEFARAVDNADGKVGTRVQYPTGDTNALIGPARQVASAIKSGGEIDALFLPAGQDELPSLAPQLASQDVDAGKVQIIGTGRWDYPNIGQERALVGGWYPAPDPAGWRTFTQRYVETYGGSPPRIASLSYDAVSLAVSLSANAQGSRYTREQLTRASGFNGVDGLFRLLPDGTSERGLAILEVQPLGPRVVDPAPQGFVNARN